MNRNNKYMCWDLRVVILLKILDCIYIYIYIQLQCVLNIFYDNVEMFEELQKR